MSSNYADAINEQLTHEVRYALRTARIDLDAFIALAGEARAARWRGWELATKIETVTLMLTRKYGEWNAELVAQWVAHYDAKWGAAPTPIEATVAAALERLADENADHARAARTAGEKGDATFFQRACTSYTNALIEWRAGVRPERLASGAWLLPSRRPGEPPHIVRHDGDYMCNCSAGAVMHWPLALIIGLEVASFDAAAEPSGEPPVDDGPLDNHGGFRAPVYDVLIIERRAVAAPARACRHCGEPIAYGRACDGCVTQRVAERRAARAAAWQQRPSRFAQEQEAIQSLDTARDQALGARIAVARASFMATVEV